MIPGTCIELHSDKFPILSGEEDEIVNDGTYGKALCIYLENKLPLAGVEVVRFLCEDWGWWIEVRVKEFTLGLQIYSDSMPGEHPRKYAIMSGIDKNRIWSWRKFRKINVGNQVSDIIDKVESVLLKDTDITFVKRHDDFPF